MQPQKARLGALVYYLPVILLLTLLKGYFVFGSIKRTILLGLALSLSIETVQFSSPSASQIRTT